MADDSKMTSLADLIKSISEGKGFKGKSMDPGFIMEMPDPYEGMSKEEKEMRKKIDKIMTERFTIDPFEGMSEEEIKKIKERNKRWREHLERARERMGLPESIQLLSSKAGGGASRLIGVGGTMDEKEQQKRLNYFDLKRDEFMALEEYLLSGLSERDLEKKAGGGMMNINKMTAPLGFENRMSMLRRSMVDEENQRMREPDIISVALTLARQEGDTSEENVNLIIDQLTALMPSVTKTMEKELTPLSTQGLKYLFDKMNIMAGKKSDPMLRRDVGFERVD